MPYAKRGLKHMTRHSASVRWGHLREIDYRIRVGSPTWMQLPLRLRHLTAWRRMHMLPGGVNAHLPVRGYGTRHAIRPSSDLPIHGKRSYPYITAPSKLHYIASRGGL